MSQAETKMFLELPSGVLADVLVSWLDAHQLTPFEVVVAENTSVEDDGSVTMRIWFERKQ